MIQISEQEAEVASDVLKKCIDYRQALADSNGLLSELVLRARRALLQSTAAYEALDEQALANKR